MGVCPASCDSRVGPGAHEMIGAEIGARNIRSDEHESYKGRKQNTVTDRRSKECCPVECPQGDTEPTE